MHEEYFCHCGMELQYFKIPQNVFNLPQVQTSLKRCNDVPQYPWYLQTHHNSMRLYASVNSPLLIQIMSCQLLSYQLSTDMDFWSNEYREQSKVEIYQNASYFDFKKYYYWLSNYHAQCPCATEEMSFFIQVVFHRNGKVINMIALVFSWDLKLAFNVSNDVSGQSSVSVLSPVHFSAWLS